MCRVEDSGKAVEGFFVLGASEGLFRASIIFMLCCAFINVMRGANLSWLNIIWREIYEPDAENGGDQSAVSVKY